MRSASLSFRVASAAALNNGAGKLPKMGYNSKIEETIFAKPESDLHSAFNAFGCIYNEEKL
jgi:alpha-galactosidase